jgi:hypothetical protein
MTSERELLLYHTAGCHLCELALEIVAPLCARSGWRLRLLDIADDEVLYERYGVRIPVLRDPKRELELGWPFDEAAVRRALA